MTTLGKRWKAKPETVAKRVANRKAKGNYSHSEETKQKISKSLFGKPTGRYSKRTVEEQKEARKETQKRYSTRNPEKYREWQVKRFYNLSPENHLAMLVSQNWTCGIAGCLSSVNKRSPVDHNHSCCFGPKSCGKCVRSILCNRHNVGLAHFRDNPEELRNAAIYVERF